LHDSASIVTSVKAITATAQHVLYHRQIRGVVCCPIPAWNHTCNMADMHTMKKPAGEHREFVDTISPSQDTSSRASDSRNDVEKRAHASAADEPRVNDAVTLKTWAVVVVSLQNLQLWQLLGSMIPG
jgi:hypothetical protein